MSFELPAVPKGNGKHPVGLVVISANNLEASSAFYAKVFGWKLHPLSKELISFIPSAGPAGALRANIETGFPGVVPYLCVPNIDAALKQIESAGGSVEKAPWTVPMVGKLARFKDASGTIYGLTEALVPGGSPHIPMPLGNNPKPPEGALCSLEMYAVDGEAAAKFFNDLFGWGSLATMPQYMAFDPGAGLGGVFQSHTPTLPAVAYIYTNDVAARLVAIEAAGGSRIGDAMDMPGAGCFGYFKDPSGTTMGLIGP